MPNLEDAIQHIRMGNRAEGRALLEDLLDADENNEDIWLWLSTVVDSDDDREICLENVLALDPDNVVAQRGIEALRSGIFDTDDLLRELMDDTAPEADEPAATFLDDFVIGEDDDLVDDDDLLLPSEARKRAKKKRGGVNVRLVVLAVLGLILVVILGGLAVASIFVFGEDGGPEATAVATQEAPGQNPQVEPSAAPTNTPTPGPTDTPTVTPVPKLQLPTPKPTDLPTPTATRVVSPTPIN